MHDHSAKQSEDSPEMCLLRNAQLTQNFPDAVETAVIDHHGIYGTYVATFIMDRNLTPYSNSLCLPQTAGEPSSKPRGRGFVLVLALAANGQIMHQLGYIDGRV